MAKSRKEIAEFRKLMRDGLEYDRLVDQYERMLPLVHRADAGTATREEVAEVQAYLERLTGKAKPPPG